MQIVCKDGSTRVVSLEVHCTSVAHYNNPRDPGVQVRCTFAAASSVIVLRCCDGVLHVASSRGLDKLCQGLSDAAVMVRALPSVLVAKLAHFLLLRAAAGEEFVHETSASRKLLLASLIIMMDCRMICEMVAAVSQQPQKHVLEIVIISAALTLGLYWLLHECKDSLQHLSTVTMSSLEDQDESDEVCDHNGWSTVQVLTSRLDLQFAPPVLQLVVLVSEWFGTPGLLSRPVFGVAFVVVYELSLLPPHESGAFHFLLFFWMAIFFYEYLTWLLLLWVLCQEVYLAAWMSSKFFQPDDLVSTCDYN